MPIGLPTDAETIRKYSTWFMIYGAVLIVLGALAVLAPNVATIAVELVIGWLLLATGVMGLVAVFSAGSSAPGFIWNLITAVVFLLAGVALLWHPAAGAVTLTFIIVAYLLAAGLAKLVLALGYRDSIPRAWGWMLLSALLDIVLGVLILLGLPGSAAWVLGLLIGINLLFTGIALVMVAVAVRALSTGGATA